jgi:hypothetical protein
LVSDWYRGKPELSLLFKFSKDRKAQILAKVLLKIESGKALITGTIRPSGGARDCIKGRNQQNQCFFMGLLIKE